jgi:hypothetical protein
MFMDQWDYLNPLFNGETWWARALQQQGPVREGLGLIVTGWILQATAWDVRYDSLWGATILLAATLLAVRVKWKMTGTIGFADIWIPVAFLSLGQFETVVSVPNTSHSVLPLALILLAANVWLSRRSAFRYLTTAIIGSFLVFTGFGLFAGAIIGVLLGVRALRHALAREYSGALYAASGFAAVALGWIRFSDGYVFQPAIEGFRFPWTPWTDYIRFIVLMLNLPTGHIGMSSRFYVRGTVLGIIVLVAALSIGWAWLKRRPSTNDDVQVLLMGSSLLFIVTTAFGRVPLGVTAGTASRYVSLMLPMWLAVYLTSAMSYRRSLPAVTVLIAVLTVMPYSTMQARPVAEWAGTLGMMDWQHDVMVFFGVNKVAWADNYLQNGTWQAAQAAVLQPLHPNPAASGFDQKLQFLREHRLSFFASADRRDYLPWLADDRFTCPASGSSPHVCR